MTTRLIAALCAAVGLVCSACGTAPQNAQEFRKMVPGAAMFKQHSFEARRPLRDVARTFELKARECLEVGVRTVSQTATSYQNILTTYKPTVLAAPQKAELHLQRNHQGSGVVMVGAPPGGHYLLVADATALDRARTRIDIYAFSVGTDVLIRAITGWATGDNLGCPDMTKAS